MQQDTILQALPAQALYLFFKLETGADASAVDQALQQLAQSPLSADVVVGLGLSLYQKIGQEPPAGLKAFPLYAQVPLAQGAPFDADVAIWLKAAQQSERLYALLAPVFHATHQVHAFSHAVGADGLGRDLTGYEDGTENPPPPERAAVAFAADGGSCWGLQQWEHQFSAFDALSRGEQDDAIGRERDSNVELTEAPLSAHVKRTAQEDFAPEAFLWRRSMPWAQTLPWQRNRPSGLMFSAFAASFYPFEAQWQRMLGLDDGVADALFQFSTPLYSGFFWCPPLQENRLLWG